MLYFCCSYGQRCLMVLLGSGISSSSEVTALSAPLTFIFTFHIFSLSSFSPWCSFSFSCYFLMLLSLGIAASITAVFFWSFSFTMSGWLAVISLLFLDLELLQDICSFILHHSWRCCSALPWDPQPILNSYLVDLDLNRVSSISVTR